ncbi:MAG: hypothetical protein ACLRMZ_10640 [Blautia marasmi]
MGKADRPPHYDHPSGEGHLWGKLAHEVNGVQIFAMGADYILRTISWAE